MDSCDLTQKKCKPCEGGTPPLSFEVTRELLAKVREWKMNGKAIEKEFKFKNFIQAMKFVNWVAELAEAESHHPDISIHYNQVRFTVWTHADRKSVV